MSVILAEVVAVIVLVMVVVVVVIVLLIARREESSCQCAGLWSDGPGSSPGWGMTLCP